MSGTGKNGELASAEVLVVSHGFQSNYECGFVNGIARNGACVVLVCSDALDCARLDSAVEARNLRGSQDPSRSPISKALNLIRYHLSLCWLVLTEPHWQVHVIGLLHPVWWCGIVQGVWFRLASRRYVLTVHNLLPHDAHTRLNRLLYGIAYRVPHALVVHTPAMKQELISKYGLAAQRIHLMEHGLDPLKESAATEDVSPDGGPVKLLFFGGLRRDKGLDVLLEALEQNVPEFRLRIAGFCADSTLAKEINALIASHPRRQWIAWFEGFVPEDDVHTWFEWAHALMLPYRHIDQSGVVFQALRYGLPVIATDVGSLRNYVDETVGLICAPDSPTALAEALQVFESRRSAYTREAIRQRALCFDWGNVTKSLARAYAHAPSSTG